MSVSQPFTPVRPLVSSDFDALCTIEEDTLHTDAEKLTKHLQRFGGFGSLQSSHGQLAAVSDNRLSKFNVSLPSEAAAPLSRDYKLSSAVKVSEDKNANNQPVMHITQATQPIDIDYNAKGLKEKFVRPKLCKEKCWPSETQRDEAWERRKDRQLASHLSENSSSKYLHKGRKIQRSISDCIGIGGPASYTSIPRTRSLTDEDLDELRGCIDLGFGFSYEADSELWDTLPALELCYAISQQLENEQSRSSPTLEFENNNLDASASFGSSIASPSASSWLVCSPGDQPKEVKERLRHWAQAVAFTVRQSYVPSSTVPNCRDVIKAS
ncbi:hypothetical protein O6H91_02G093300 [Diphasiastrum complanatum]|uniref:Uncharacterized protein n=1 Tax=Diphasiastrum complanatum TaxID=34168 RepID=A0ACC2EI98_DIPCM|nr:hypothetical protein O6H91_02G093300 [Diphasiastrum complanatum]